MLDFFRKRILLEATSVLGLIVAGWSTLARAEKVNTGTPKIVGSLTVNQPTALPPVDGFYQLYISKVDPTIERLYSDRWSYHEKQIPYAMASYDYEHLSIGSRDFYGSAPYEGDVRGQFAQQVFRMRLDSATRAYFAQPGRAQDIKRAEKTLRKLDSIKNGTSVHIGSTKDGGIPTEVRMGYDVISDSSKLEVARGTLLVGFYHPHLIGAMSGGAAFSQLSLRVSTSFGRTIPSAYVAYRMAASIFDAGLSKPLTRSVTGQIVTSQGLGPTADPTLNSYRLVFNYSF